MPKRFHEKHPLVSRLEQNYNLLIFFVILIANSTFAASSLPIPPNSSFAPPSPNTCQSNYDQFYIAEPGVYAYWSLCERGTNPIIFDYAGRFDLTPASSAWSSGPGTIQGGLPGPVPDGETADQVETASSFCCKSGYSNEYQSGNGSTMGKHGFHGCAYTYDLFRAGVRSRQIQPFCANPYSVKQRMLYGKVWQLVRLLL